MQHIHILAVGGLKEAGFAASCAEYVKRLGAYCKLDICEIAEERLPKNPSDAQIAACIEAEGARIIQKLPPKAYCVPLCIEGKQLTSAGLSTTLERLRDSQPHVAFVIGGSYGLSEAVKQRGQLKLSMSEMTFPHQLARVMLLEQLYRACSIIGGGKYHK